jgi:hypothetical protein
MPALDGSPRTWIYFEYASILGCHFGMPRSCCVEEFNGDNQLHRRHPVILAFACSDFLDCVTIRSAIVYCCVAIHTVGGKLMLGAGPILILVVTSEE